MPNSNKLMEAAAEILSGSKKKAPAMPPQKLDGTVEDLGGPTPQDGKPTDDSEKIDTSKGSKDNAEHNRGTIKAKASAASGKVVDHLNREENEDYSGDMDAIFEDGTVTEDFKVKAATIFEARVHDRVTTIKEELETSYAAMLEEAVNTIQEELSNKVDDYLAYVVEQWMNQNQLAIETGLRNELAEEFISGLKNLFTEHYIDVPESKVDLVDELAGRVVELEGKLDEEIEKNVNFKKELTESHRNEIFNTICENLTDTQVEKMKTLTESVEFSTEDEYKEKLGIIKESYFKSGVKKSEASQLFEVIEQEEPKVASNDPFVAAVSNAISATSR